MRQRQTVVPSLFITREQDLALHFGNERWRPRLLWKRHGILMGVCYCRSNQSYIFERVDIQEAWEEGRYRFSLPQVHSISHGVGIMIPMVGSYILYIVPSYRHPTGK